MSWGWGIPLQLLLLPPHSAPVSDAPGAEHTLREPGQEWRAYLIHHGRDPCLGGLTQCACVYGGDRVGSARMW